MEARQPADPLHSFEAVEPRLPIPLSHLVTRASCGESDDSSSLQQTAQVKPGRLHVITQMLCEPPSVSACKI